MPERTPDPQVVPYLLYADAGAAMDWLIKTFVFTERVRDKRSDETVRHAELLLDSGGVIMLGSAGPGFRGPRELGEVTQMQCITVTDVPTHRDRPKPPAPPCPRSASGRTRPAATPSTIPKATAGTSASPCPELRLDVELLDGIGRHVHRLQQLPQLIPLLSSGISEATAG